MSESSVYNDEKTMAFYDNEDIKNDPVTGWIVPVNGSFKGKSFMLRAGNNFIGRESSADVPLVNDRNLLDRHATILFDPNSGRFFISPMERGAFVLVDNKQIVESTELKSRQLVTVGNTELMFVAFCGERFRW